MLALLGQEKEVTRGAVVNKRDFCTRNVLFWALAEWARRMIATKHASEVCVSKYMGSEKETYEVVRRLVVNSPAFPVSLYYHYSAVYPYRLRPLVPRSHLEISVYIEGCGP